MRVLLTGGAGYIGSHVAVELLNEGHQIIIVDDHSNSSPNVIDQINKITSKSFIFYYSDIRDASVLDVIFEEYEIDAVIHLAGYKAVGESVLNPLKYYYNNLESTLSLLKIMLKHNVNKIIFSSSATVYGQNNTVPYTEEMSKGKCSNPYGWTKFMIEQMLEDICRANKNFSAISLRYFNPIGAHESGLIGENPRDIPNNLMPYIMQTAAGIREQLTVFGNDYPTKDGTCTRDYIHVVDLAKGHVKALNYITDHNSYEIFNLGTGNPYSVLDVISAFEKVNNLKLNYKFGDRREGDLPECYANVDKANRMLKWAAEKTLEDMCRDSWNFQKNNLCKE